MRSKSHARKFLDAVRRFFEKRPKLVWHGDSPGVRTYVRRGPLQRALYSDMFSDCSEPHLTAEECFPTLQDEALRSAIDRLHKDFRQRRDALASK
jgi:hypothetical protein